MKKTIKECDIKDRVHRGEVESIEIDVMFDHDQEDGKSKIKPYFDTVNIEMCEGCEDYMFQERRLIYAYGAQGYNDYSL